MNEKEMFSDSTRGALPARLNDRAAWYGWVIVVLAAVAMIATLPGRTHGLGMITERLLSDRSLELDRQLFGQVNLWATLIGALFCLPCGWMLDRLGTRACLALVVAMLGLVVLAMTQAHGLMQFAVLITLTRGLGQSALSVISISMIGKWFQKQLPVATAVYSILVSVGFAVAFGWGRGQMDLTWRTQWQTLGFALTALVPLFGLLVRSAPQNVESISDKPSLSATNDFTFVEVLASPAFWLLAISTSFYGLISSGMSLFNESLLVERGFQKNAYYNLSMLTTIVGLIANLATGCVTTRIKMTTIAGVAMSLLTLALLGLPLVKTQSQLVVYAIVMGCAGGMVTVLFFAVFARLFGRTHLGEIQGLAQMLTVFASALGPVVLAEAKVRMGSYIPAIQCLGGAALALAVLVTIVPQPRPINSYSSKVEP